MATDLQLLRIIKPIVMVVVFLTVMDIGVQMKTSTSRASQLKTIQQIAKAAGYT